MGRLRLEYDLGRRQFGLRARIECANSSGEAIARLVLDTGTGVSAISDLVAAQLGVDIGSLEMRDTGGVTAVEKRPRLRDVAFWIVGDDVARIELDEALVLTEVHRKARTGKSGWERRPSTRLVAPCLFGMDALTALKGRAILNPSQAEGWIEW